MHKRLSKGGYIVIKSFRQLRQNLSQNNKKNTVVIAAAQDEEIVLMIKEMYETGIAKTILVGDVSKINPMLKKLGFGYPLEIIDEPDDKKAALLASDIVRKKQADILMKGLVNSSDFLKAVLDKEHGIRSNQILCHLAAFEIPGFNKLAFHADGGMNLYPSLEEKKQIVLTTVEALQNMGIKKPKVAVLAANEVETPKMPATMDAAVLRRMNENGEIPGCIIEGPIAMDVALSKEAAEHKKIKSVVSGTVDLFVVPNIDAGNMVGKTLIYCAKAKMAGVILGATNPIVMTSRSDNAEGKMNSLALACACLNKEED